MITGLKIVTTTKLLHTFLGNIESVSLCLAILGDPIKKNAKMKEGEGEEEEELIQVVEEEGR